MPRLQQLLKTFQEVTVLPVHYSLLASLCPSRAQGSPHHGARNGAEQEGDLRTVTTGPSLVMPSSLRKAFSGDDF